MTDNGNHVSRRFLINSALAGIVAGGVMGMAAIIVSVSSGGSFWEPLRLVATLTGFSEGAGFALLPVAGSLIAHIALSGAYGIAVGLVVRRLPISATVMVAGLWGIVSWAFGAYMLGNLFPGLEAFVAWQGSQVWFALHAVFGLALGAGLVAVKARAPEATFDNGALESPVPARRVAAAA